MKRIFIFAHRGASREAAENTRTAFDKALNYAVDGMETDVQLSRDEVPVLWHDRFLDKVGLPDKRIDDYDYAQLRAMNFAAHFSSELMPESLLTLQEFLDCYRRHCSLLIEIKNRAWEPTCRHELKIRQTLERIGVWTGCPCGQDARIPANNEIMVSSFNLASLVYAHQCAPQFPLIYNLEPWQKLQDARNVLIEQSFLHGLCLPVESLDDAMVELLRSHGKFIVVYTCNSDEQISRALELGVDILISDIPQKAIQMRDLQQRIQ